LILPGAASAGDQLAGSVLLEGRFLFRRICAIKNGNTSQLLWTFCCFEKSGQWASIVALRYLVFALSRKYRGNRLVNHQQQIDRLMDLAAFYVATTRSTAENVRFPMKFAFRAEMHPACSQNGS